MFSCTCNLKVGLPMLRDETFRLLVEGVTDYGIYLLDEHGTVLSWNAGAEFAEGYSAEEVIGQNCEIFYSPADRAAGLPQRNLQTAHDTGHFTDEGWRHRKDGTAFWSSAVINPIYDGSGALVGFAKITRDLTKQRAIEQRLTQQAMHDSLTGLFNRAAFLDRLEEELPQIVYGSTVAVFYVDLDRFKPVNQLFGHLAGDEVLREVASRLKAIVGANGMAARLGGDEFVVLRVGTLNPRTVLEFAQVIVDRLAEPFSVSNAAITIGASVGVAHAPMQATEAMTLLRNADLALKEAKQNGRGQFHVFDPCLEEQELSRSVIELKLRHAMKANAFELHYQPVVNAATLRPIGFEALIRWRDQTGRSISPAEFIPIAETMGLMPELGAWVLRTACHEAAAWDEDQTISVNVSATQLCNIGFIDVVRDALTTFGLPANRLELEITETAILDDQELARSILLSLRELGVQIALDDFGTGFSSLSMVAALPLTRIKIDRSFVQNIDGTSQSTSIIRSVAALCQGYGLAMTAEGVETAEQVAILRRHGCEDMQGYYFGYPKASGRWMAAARPPLSA